MKTYKLLHKVKYYPIFILFFCFIVSCGGKFFDPPDLRKIPGNAKEKREKNIREGRGFRIGNLMDKGGSGTFDFATSNQMWRATLELLDFTPLQNVDYSGGIIVTDWFKEQDNQDSIKITVLQICIALWNLNHIADIFHADICGLRGRKGLAIHNVMFNNGSISNPIIAYSEINTRGMGYNILMYEVYLAESDVSLDFTEFFKTGRVLFAEEETPDARYGPSSVTYEIMRGDINLANNYEVEYFLIPNDKYVPKIQDGVVLDLVYISLLESNSYKQFEDEKVKVYSIYV